MTFDPHAVEIGFVDSTELAYQFLQWINTDRRLVGVDVETDGFNWYDGKLRLVQFGDEQSGWAVPYERFPNVVTEALEILDRRRTPVVGHNFKFDMHWLERNTGWTLDRTTWNRMHDTMLLAGVLDSSGTKALKDLAEFYVHPVAKHGQKELHEDMKRGGWGWDNVPVGLQSYWLYGVLDTILTVNLFNVLYFKAQQAGVMDAYEVERASTPVLYHMERKGMLVDGDYCTAEQDACYARCDEIKSLAAEMGVMNITSGPQIAKALISRGVELYEKTPSGMWAMDADTLAEISSRTGDPLAQMIVEYRHTWKMAGAYYGNFTKFQRSDGRVHPSFRQIQARTGRMSATDPAVQTIPRPGEDGDVSSKVRNAFVAPDGHVLVSTDFKAVEARIFAHFAQEQGMLQAIRDGVDLHGYTAMQMYHLPTIADKHDPLRQIAKSVLFALLFGGGKDTVAQTAGVPVDTAVEAITRIHAAFPGIKRFQKRMTQQAMENYEDNGKAFIRGIDGRVLSLEENDDRFYAMTNYAIQGTATVVLKQRLAVIDAMGLKDYCICAIHDEVVCEVPASDEEDFRKAITEAMDDYEQFDVPIESDTGPGAPRLGQCK
jgi:DNA polymerase-1